MAEIHGCISTGKEANVYHAMTESGEHRALKVYKTSILVFKVGYFLHTRYKLPFRIVRNIWPENLDGRNIVRATLEKWWQLGQKKK